MNSQMKLRYLPPQPKLWQGRDSKSDEYQYWHQVVQLIHAQKLGSNNLENKKSKIALLGYSCDEGVYRNQGRVGAVKSPKVIRERLAKIAYHANDKQIFDIGDVTCIDGNMEATQNIFSNLISKLLSLSIFPIGLGGGHDIAYGHFLGIHDFLKTTPHQKIGIINFDAHFDLRPVVSTSNSGTPFNQILSEYENAVSYLVLGIQKQSNTKDLFDIAKKYDVEYITNIECAKSDLSITEERIADFIGRNDKIYLTIDMDGFSSAFAPGVSAPSPLGMNPFVFFQLLTPILKSEKVISCDINELNSIYDQDNCTANLAARIVDFIMDCAP